jgi:hypothetical protein
LLQFEYHPPKSQSVQRFVDLLDYVSPRLSIRNFTRHEQPSLRDFHTHRFHLGVFLILTPEAPITFSSACKRTLSVVAVANNPIVRPQQCNKREAELMGLSAQVESARDTRFHPHGSPVAELLDDHPART